MACEFLTGDGVVYCVWGRPTTNDMDQVLLHLKANVEAAGRPAVYITRVPVDAPAPDAKVREYLNSLMPKIAGLCSTYHVVLEGAGFIAALKRGVLLSMFQMGNKRGTFFVHADVDEIFRNIKAERQLAVRALLIRADARGLLRGPTPVSVTPQSKDQKDSSSSSGVRCQPDQASKVADSALR